MIQERIQSFRLVDIALIGLFELADDVHSELKQTKHILAVSTR